MVHEPQAEAEAAAIRAGVSTGRPYGDEAWVSRLAKALEIDLTIRPRGRPRNPRKTSE